MKLEMDHVLGVQSPPRKSYNPFDPDDEIEATNGYLKSNLNGYDIKSFETNADSLTFHLDNNDISWEEAILRHSQILRHSITGDSNDEELIPRKDTELFTDKTVTECHLPEMMVKENAYHSVKDIGIDEGVIKSRDKNGSENTPVFLNLDGEMLEGFKSRSETNLEKDVSSEKRPQDIVKDNGQDHENLKKQPVADQCGVDDSTNLDDTKLNSSKEQSNVSLESTLDQVDIGKEVVSSRESTLDEIGILSSEKIESKEEVVIKEQGVDTSCVEKTHESTTMMSPTDSAEVTTDSEESVYEEATSSLVSPESGVTNVMSYNSKVESGSIILDFNSSTVKQKEDEEVPPHIETIAKPPEAQSMSRIDEGRVLDSETGNRVNGETSFSAAMAPPSSITYLGPFSHAGNISLRSESSCGSTRSFAFPVLQTEYISSPVRMAKAEHRNRKLRGWFHSVMCCRF